MLFSHAAFRHSAAAPAFSAMALGVLTRAHVTRCTGKPFVLHFDTATNAGMVIRISISSLFKVMHATDGNVQHASFSSFFFAVLSNGRCGSPACGCCGGAAGGRGGRVVWCWTPTPHPPPGMADQIRVFYFWSFVVLPVLYFNAGVQGDVYMAAVPVSAPLRCLLLVQDATLTAPPARTS